MIAHLMQHCKSKLQTYAQRLDTALDGINTEQVWWKPNQNSLSIGIILQHLNGNVGQWLVSGLGKQADKRKRKLEFKGDYKTEARVLLQQLNETLHKAYQIINETENDEWQQTINVQGFTLKKSEVLLDVMEHFSWHTGQVIYIVKLLKGANHGIAFYDDSKLNTVHNQ